MDIADCCGTVACWLLVSIKKTPLVAQERHWFWGLPLQEIGYQRNLTPAKKLRVSLPKPVPRPTSIEEKSL